MVHPPALVLSAVVLFAVLVAAAAGARRVPPGLVAMPGAAVLIAFGAVGPGQALGAMRSIAPTVAFLVVILLLAHLADREGLFTWAAAATGRRADGSATALFARVVVLSAVVTAALSLDATVVLLTPMVVATARSMGVSGRPHAFAAGHLANSASLLLPVSNLTNLLAFAATGLSFSRFTALMAAPWLVAVAVEWVLLRLLFRRDLAAPVRTPVHDVPRPPVLSLIVVGLVVAGFGIGDAVGVAPVWPALAGVLVLAVRQLRHQKTTPAELVRAADLPFAASVLGLAVVVLAVLDNGVAEALVHVLPLGASLVSLLAAAAIAAVLANLLNNLPATLALLPVASAGGPATVLAVLIGVNIGPNLTYVGSLANLLWRRVLGRHAPDAAGFSLVGLATVPIALVGATAALWLTLQAGLPAPSDLELDRRAWRRRRARRSTLVALASTLVFAVAAYLVVTRAPGWPRVQTTFFSPTVAWESLPEILAGLWLNVQVLVVGGFLVLVVGLLVAMLRTLRGPAFAPLRIVATAYVDLFRGMPLIIVLYLVGFGFPALGLQGVPTSPFVLGTAAIVLVYGAYVAEVFRAGIESVHPSQRAAARSLGLAHRQTMRIVVLPQALRTVTPALLNDFVALQKDVGLISVLGAIDAVRQAQILVGQSFNFTPYVVAGLLFVLLAVPSARLADAVSARARRRQQSGSLL